MDEEKKNKTIDFIRKAKIAYDVFNEVGTTVATSIMFDRRMSSLESYDNSITKYYLKNRDDFPNLRDRKEVTFKSGKNKLVGYLYEVPYPKALILCAHGIRSLSDDYNAIYQSYFVSHGFNVLAIDLTASGRSQGSYIDGLHQSAFDIAAAIKFIKKDRRLRKLPLCLVGHSWSGYGVCAALNYEDDVKCVVSLSGFYSPDVVMASLVKSKVGLLADLNKSKLDEANERRSGKDNPYISAIDGINKANNTHILLIHGENDEIININRASIISKMNDITNKNVKGIILKEKKHADIWLSYEAIESLNKAKELGSKLLKQYKKINKIPEEEIKTFQESIDKERNSQIDEILFQKIIDFIEESI